MKKVCEFCNGRGRIEVADIRSGKKWYQPCACMEEKKPPMGYMGKGKHLQAIADLKVGVKLGQTDSWPKYWQEFAQQLLEDVAYLEGYIEQLGGQDTWKQFKEWEV